MEITKRDCRLLKFKVRNKNFFVFYSFSSGMTLNMILPSYIAQIIYDFWVESLDFKWYKNLINYAYICCADSDNLLSFQVQNSIFSYLIYRYIYKTILLELRLNGMKLNRYYYKPKESTLTNESARLFTKESLIYNLKNVFIYGSRLYL